MLRTLYCRKFLPLAADIDFRCFSKEYVSAFMLNYKIAKRAKKDGRFYLYSSINCLTDDTWVCQTLLRNMRRMNAFAF